jgi:hypothetical protein
MWLAPLSPDGVYVMTDNMVNQDLSRVTNAGGNTLLQDGLAPGRWDAMWFDPLTANHQRLFRGGYLFATADGWATVNSPSVISPVPTSFAPWSGADTDQMLVGLTLGTHIVGALYGEDDVTAVGIAGANAGTSPYADSIPATCGGLATGGVAAVDAVGVVHTYGVAMPGYAGTERGTPMEGDRASWETGVTHADDWAAGDSHHPVVTVGTDAAELLELSGQELQLKAQVANTFLGGPASGAAADPTFHALTSNDLPEHAHTESDITDLDHADAEAIHHVDFSASEGFMHKTGEETYEAIKSNLAASAAPTAANDSGEGYAVGSLWIDTTADKAYQCLDATENAAVWTEITQAGGTTIDELDDIGDVNASSPSDGDVLTWDGSEWVADAPAGGGGAAVSDPVFIVAGALSTGTAQGNAWVCPRLATIVAVYVYCETAGSASSTIVDVNKNGTTVFSTQANSGTPDVTSLAETDVLSVDVDQVATGAADLTVIVALQVTATDAADITYTPDVAADWDSSTDPGDVDAALDQLADRVDDLEGAGAYKWIGYAYNDTTRAFSTLNTWEDIGGTSIVFTAVASAVYKVTVMLDYAFTDASWAHHQIRVTIDDSPAGSPANWWVHRQNSSSSSDVLRTSAALFVLSSLSAGEVELNVQTHDSNSDVNRSVVQSMVTIERVA